MSASSASVPADGLFESSGKKFLKGKGSIPIRLSRGVGVGVDDRLAVAVAGGIRYAVAVLEGLALGVLDNVAGAAEGVLLGVRVGVLVRVGCEAADVVGVLLAVAEAAGVAFVDVADTVGVTVAATCRGNPCGCPPPACGSTPSCCSPS